METSIIQSSDLKVLLHSCKEHPGSMYFAALLYACILGMLSLVDSIPVYQDSLKNSVKMQANTIITRINKHNEELNISLKIIIAPERYPEIPANKPIQGLGSIMDTITIFQYVLQKLANVHGSQLHSDLSTLLGYLKDRMTSMRCVPKEPTDLSSLDGFFKVHASHQVTVRYMALDRLKQFMQKLIVNLDQLKIC